MQISDQGFTERLSSQPTRSSGRGDSAQASKSTGSRYGSSSDNLQLSSLASLLQNASSVDSNRSARLSQIAKAVQSNTFQIRPMEMSKALVSEAVQSKAA